MDYSLKSLFNKTCTVEPLYRGPIWTGKSVLISEVILYTKATFGTPGSVQIIVVLG